MLLLWWHGCAQVNVLLYVNVMTQNAINRCLTPPQCKDAVHSTLQWKRICTVNWTAHPQPLDIRRIGIQNKGVGSVRSSQAPYISVTVSSISCKWKAQIICTPSRLLKKKILLRGSRTYINLLILAARRSGNYSGTFESPSESSEKEEEE